MPLPRKPSADLARLPARLRRAVRETRAVLDGVEADVMIGFGGYVAVPAYLAARSVRRGRRVPVVVHEANASAGWANRVGARSARGCSRPFPIPAWVPSRWSGCRCGEHHVAGPPGVARRGARVLRLRRRRPGAAGVRRLAGCAIAEPGGRGGCGRPCPARCFGAARARPEEHPRPAQPGPGEPPYVAVPYLDRMDLAYAAADLAICRSGAMTVAEVTAVGLPAVYVPLPIGNGEQRLNALPVVEAGGGLIVDDRDLTPEFVAGTVAGLLTDRDRLAVMTAARRWPVTPTRHSGSPRSRSTSRRPRAAGGSGGERQALPPSCSGCTWSASAAPACRASPASCWTAAAWCPGRMPRIRAPCRALQARGAQVRIGHDASALDMLPGGPTAVVTTHAAIPKTNPELVEARRRGIPVILRPAVLAQLMAGQTTLMVTGTAGKTTTTSMLIVALQHSGFDPSFAVGGDSGEPGTNAHHGSGDYFVAEADESDGSLVQYTPDVAVVTNIEADHLDFFGTAQAYVDVFDAFVERLTPGGSVVVCVDDPGAAAFAERTAALGIRVLRYGSGDRSRSAAGRYAAGLAAAGDRPPWPRCSWRGRPRRARDAALGARPAHGAQRAGRAAGGDAGRRHPGRRARRAGRIRGRAAPVRVGGQRGRGACLRRLRPPSDEGHRRADDGHGPGAGVGRPCRCRLPAPLVFPHKGFRRGVRAGAESGRRGLRARRVRRPEQPLAGVSGATIAEAVRAPVTYLPDFSTVAATVAAAARPGDVVVTMGAGDVTLLGKEILTELSLRADRGAGGAQPR